MWSIVLTSLRLRPPQTVEAPLALVEEAVAVVENAETPKEKKKKTELDKMNAYRRKRILKNRKLTKDKDNIAESNEGRSTDIYDVDETWDGRQHEETNEERVADSLSNVESGHELQEYHLVPEVEGDSTLDHVVVKEPNVATAAPLEIRESMQSSSSSPSPRLLPAARSGRGQSRRQKRNARMKEMKKAPGARKDKGKKRCDAKEKGASGGQVEESRPADDSEMPENGVVGHEEVNKEEIVPSSHYPLVRSMYAHADDDHELYKDFLSLVLRDQESLFRLGFPRQEGLDVFHFYDQKTPLKRIMSNPASTPPHFTPAAAVPSPPYSSPPLQNSTSASYQSNNTESSSRACVGYEQLAYNGTKGILRDLSLAPSIRPFWEGEKKCCRCGVIFRLTQTGEQIAFPKSCLYHWDNKGREELYKCCGNRVNESPGCSQEEFHVYQHKVVGVEKLPHPYHGFIRAIRSKDKGEGKASRDVVSLDCEMVYTVAGLRLAQVVVVDVRGFVIYSTYVRPYEMILSLNTEHSGVREEDLEGPEVKRLPEVQKDIRDGVITDSTIIIGHALHNDLKVLKILHNLIVDTKILYGHTGIKDLSGLSKAFLNREIQNSYGHECVQDARAALDLALRFVGEWKQGSKENFKTW